ncbi:Uncharacterised protein [Bordetella pertussis]|nr:Uncharacterised protein [Bordetella pertussis]
MDVIMPGSMAVCGPGAARYEMTCGPSCTLSK